MPWTALVGGLIAGAATGALNYASARQQQQETIDAYKHRHQWQTQDLRAAGLNPILSATQGAGSVGSMAQAQAPDISQATSNFSAAQLRKEEINTAKTTQTQQLAQSANLAASAREADANASIAEKVAAYYDSNPELIGMRAKTQAGLNPSSPIGAAGQAVHELAPSANKARETLTSSAKELWRDRAANNPAAKINAKHGKEMLPVGTPWKGFKPFK